jgi:hypothetical protein
MILLIYMILLMCYRYLVDTHLASFQRELRHSRIKGPDTGLTCVTIFSTFSSKEGSCSCFLADTSVRELSSVLTVARPKSGERVPRCSTFRAAASLPNGFGPIYCWKTTVAPCNPGLSRAWHPSFQGERAYPCSLSDQLFVVGGNTDDTSQQSS